MSGRATGISAPNIAAAPFTIVAAAPLDTAGSRKNPDHEGAASVFWDGRVQRNADRSNVAKVDDVHFSSSTVCISNFADPNDSRKAQMHLIQPAASSSGQGVGGLLYTMRYPVKGLRVILCLGDRTLSSLPSR
jgi:hypothetical protein